MMPLSAAVPQKEARDVEQVDMNLTTESSPYQVVPNGTSLRANLSMKKRKKKAPSPSLTWKQLNQLLGSEMGLLPRTADPTGEVPGRVVTR